MEFGERPDQGQEGTFRKEGMACAKAMRQGEPGGTRGWQVGQGSEGETAGQWSVEGSGRPRGGWTHCGPALLSLPETQQGAQESALRELAF